MAVNYNQKVCKLHAVQDQGAVGWDLGMCLFNQWQCRGTLEADFVHACMNQVQGACKGAGLHLVAMEVTVVINFTGGPFKNDGHFSELMSSALEFFTNDDIQSPMFQMYYENIAKDHRMNLEDDFGSTEHMQKTWEHASQ